ncbi:MAG TPA: methyltransferase domain-containing protein [Acidimicrobiales bacterium]|nr:methyltransferase domain-containing protein [Acidimicrobiales bacterium]
MSNTQAFLAANRANWDERVPTHLESAYYDVEGWLRRRPGPEPQELEALGDVAGLQLVHLQCHFGLDTLAWARVGATVTGLDFSPAAIAAARDLAVRAGLSDRSRFVCADVYQASATLEGALFDIVYVNLGALCWLPSVDGWAAEVAALVTPGGRFYIHDGHPLAWALAQDEPRIENTYFEENTPCIDDSGYTYADAEPLAVNRRSYQWNHGIGQIVTAVIGHGLRLEWLREHDWAYWPNFPWLIQNAEGKWTSPPNQPCLPLSFSLLATKPV